MTAEVLILFGNRGSGKDTIGDYLKENYDYQKESFAAPLKTMVKEAFPDFTLDDLYGESSRRETQYSQYPLKGQCLGCGGRLVQGDDDPASDLICPKCRIEYPRNVNPRIALQTLGTEWGRRLYPNIWIDGLFSRVNERTNRLHLTEKSRALNSESLNAVIRERGGKAMQNLVPPYRWVVTDGRFPNEQSRSAELGAKTVKLLRGSETPTSGHASESLLSSIPAANFSYILDNDCPLDQVWERVDTMMSELVPEARKIR
jgi:hypothetical protein